MIFNGSSTLLTVTLAIICTREIVLPENRSQRDPKGMNKVGMLTKLYIVYRVLVRIYPS